MKTILNRRTIVIFSTAVLLALIAIVSVNIFGSSGPVTGAANTIMNPLRVMLSNVARTFGILYSSMYEYEQLLARNEELSERVAELERITREAQLLESENADLRAQLGFIERHGGYSSEMASIITKGGDNWSSSFIIDKGYANSNIGRGMAVVTELGALVGQVHDVGPTSSTVITILDTKFSASAYVGLTDIFEEAGTPCVARGDFSHMGSGMLILDRIDDELTVRRVDTVMTSGDGGVYPSGLVIGEIIDVFRHENGIGRYATIAPNANIDNLTDVFYITEYEVAE